jgi:hypothetical protein
MSARVKIVKFVNQEVVPRYFIVGYNSLSETWVREAQVIYESTVFHIGVGRTRFCLAIAEGRYGPSCCA